MYKKRYHTPCYKSPKTFRLMGCATSLFAIAIAVILIISLINAFIGTINGWIITALFIYLFATLCVGSGLSTLFFSYASFLDCDCDLDTEE